LARIAALRVVALEGVVLLIPGYRAVPGGSCGACLARALGEAIGYHRRLGPLSPPGHSWRQALSPGPQLQVNSGSSISLSAVVPCPLASAGAL
jgi:hypothetical protein